MILKLTDQQIESMAYRLFELQKLEKEGRELVKENDLISIKKEKTLIGNLMKAKEIDLMADDITTFKVGDIIEHSRFGEGEIIKIDDVWGSKKADINFKDVGLKKLLLGFGLFNVMKKKSEEV